MFGADLPTGSQDAPARWHDRWRPTYWVGCHRWGQRAGVSVAQGTAYGVGQGCALDYSTTEPILNELFSLIGEVVSVNLITDRMTGRSRGFASVEMAESTAAGEAISQLDGKTVGERTIKVNEARPKRQQNNQWGGGGGSRRRY